MNDEEIEIIKRELKAKDKLIKVISRINKLPDAQRKILEAMNLIGPNHDKEMDVLIKDHKEIKKWFKGIEKKKSGYEGMSVEAILEHISIGKMPTG